MPRIRSVHPALWTDEAFASLSDAAQILLIGLWTEADDNGIFEWKPLTLKMRLRPGRPESAADIEALLDELFEARVILKFDAERKTYGAIRNFTKFQRPKEPKSVHPFPENIWSYIGLTSEGDRPRTTKGRPPKKSISERARATAPRISEGFRKSFGNDSEIACQREEGEEDVDSLFQAEEVGLTHSYAPPHEDIDYDEEHPFGRLVA